MKKNFLLICIFFISQNSKSQNEDFEEGSLTNPTSPSTIVVTTPNAINGWTVNGGSNSTWGINGNCTNTTAITGNPNACMLINPGAAGHIDSIIGSVYPIYSVFGNGATTYSAATIANGFQCYGDWFIKINNKNPGSGVNRISRKINVTPSNAIFNFAFMNVLEGGHCCCNNSGFTFKVKVSSGCAGPSTYTSCPQFSASASSSLGCTPFGSCLTMVSGASYSPSSIVSNWIYNKWQMSTIDLSLYIGLCVTIEITAFDSPSGLRAGYTYFDAKHETMALTVNGFTCYVPNPTVSTCGAVTTTLTAPSTAWGYTWTIPGPTTIVGVQTITTNVTGNHTLTMSGGGACSPIVRVINLINTPSPILAVSSLTQASCTNSINTVALSFSSGTPNSANVPNYNISFAPSMPTNTLSVSANSGTYSGLSIGVNSVTITDSLGCATTSTIAMTTCGVGIKELEWSKNILISPNPNSGKFNLEINEGINNGEIRLMNAIGQEVFKQTVKQGKNEINASVLARGIYYYSIYQNKEPVGKGKIIIE